MTTYAAFVLLGLLPVAVAIDTAARPTRPQRPTGRHRGRTTAYLISPKWRHR